MYVAQMYDKREPKQAVQTDGQPGKALVFQEALSLRKNKIRRVHESCFGSSLLD